MSKFRARVNRAACALLLVMIASCSRCGAPPVKDAAELLPAQWTSVISTAPLGQLAQHTSSIVQLAAQIPGGEIVGEFAKGLSLQLGVDLMTREGLLAAGIDPERSAAVALLALPAGEDTRSNPPFLAVFPLSDQSKFAQRVESTLVDRVGFSIRADEPRGNVHCVVFSSARLPEKFGYAIVRGYGVVAHGTDPAALIAEVAARTIDKSLAADPRFLRARSELEHPDLTIWSASGNPLLARLTKRSLPGDSALGVSFLPDGLLVRLTQDLAEAQRADLRTLFAAVAPPEAFQTPQAPIELRINAVPAQLPSLFARAPVLRELLANLRAAFAKSGADLDRDLFAALSPGASLSLDLAPGANLGRALDPSALDLRAHSPFDVIRLYAAAGARDPEAVRKGFIALAQALPLIGATAVRSAEKKAIAGGLVDEWSTHYSGGEGIRFGLFVPGRDLCGASAPARTQALVYAIGGTGSLEDVLASRLPCAHENAANAASSEAAPVQLQLDLGALADAINKLPDSAYGSGPQVFVARSLVSQVIVPMQRLRASAEMRPSERGFAATVRLRVAPATGAQDSGAPPPSPAP